MTLHIIDENGREGVVVRTNNQGILARPVDVPAEFEEDGARYMIRTDFFWQEDGSLLGIWFDSPPNGFVTAHIL